MKAISLIFFLTTLRLGKWSANAYCDGLYRPCCAGEMLISANYCVACPPGFHGANCTSECTYPYYGRKCLDGECSCPKELCNIATGCEQISTDGEENLDQLNATMAESSTFDSSQQNVEKGASSPNEIFKNPVLLGIFGVNFIFLFLILTYICKRTRKSCSSKKIKTHPKKVSENNVEPYYEELDHLQTNTDISIDYNTLNLSGSCSSPKSSLSSAESSNFNESGKSTKYSYDDVANVVGDVRS